MSVHMSSISHQTHQSPPLAFSDVGILVLVAASKLICSFMFLKKLPSFGDSEEFSDMKSLGFLGVLYALLNIVGYGPYSPERYFVPSDTRIVSILLVPAVMVCLSMERLDFVRLLSFGLLVAASRNAEAFLSHPEDPRNYVFVAAYAILRVYHSLELKKSPAVSIHAQNIVVSVFSLLTYFTVFGCEAAGMLHIPRNPATHGILAGLPIIVIGIAQSLIEIYAAILYKSSSVIVPELAMSLASILISVTTTLHEHPQLIYLKLTSCGLAFAAITQYFRGPYTFFYTDTGKPIEISLESVKDIDDATAKPLAPQPHEKLLKRKSAVLRIIAIAMITLGSLSRNHSVVPPHTPNSLRVGSALVPLTKSHQIPLQDKHKSFYDKTISIMIADDMGNDILRNMLRTFEKYCLDCNRVRFTLLTRNHAEAEQIRRDFPFLERLEIVRFDQVYPDLKKHDYSEDVFLAQKGGGTFHSMKQLMGCLYAETTYCWMMDSNSFMFQNTSIRDMVIGYYSSPYIVYSSNSRSTFGPLRAAVDIFGYKERFGWPVEEYLWIFENSILHRIKEILDFKFPSVLEYPEEIYIQILYYVYIIHNYQRFSYYRIVDSANILGPYWSETDRQVVGLGPMEDLRVALSRNPALVYAVAERFIAYNIKIYKVSDGGIYGDIASSSRFLDVATSVKMVIGSRNQPMLQMALDGRWANRTGMFGKHDILKYCEHSIWIANQTTYC
ncbi:hypothetical protein HDU97_007199 [Phlyctochytrium planicorne]|nr:hypothetical protein HDU97_007199 [Phlyctochytrium planicorne]